MGGKLITTSGPALEKMADLMGILTKLETGDVLFIDEIHRTPRTIEEYLYPAMEDFAVDFVLDKGPFAKAIRLPVKRVHAGRRDDAGGPAGLAAARPLRPALSPRLLHARPSLRRSSGARPICSASSSTPRPPPRSPGAREGRRASPTACCGGCATTPRSRATRPSAWTMAQASLQLEGVDDEGLDELDRKVLCAIIPRYSGGPVGIEALAATLQEETDTLTDVVEPYLLQQGFVIRTSAGRRATRRAYDHLGIERPRTIRRDQPPLL